MNLMNFFKRPGSAPVARERLQILLAHERAVVGKSDLIAILQEEILAVVAKHFPVEPESIKVKMERGDAVSTLEVEVEIPTPMCVNIAVSTPKAKLAKEPAAKELTSKELTSKESAKEPAAAEAVEVHAEAES